MQSTTQVRAPRSMFVLWKWTGISAVLHTLLVGALCGVSYLGFAKREAAAKAKVAAQEATAAKAEADEAAKNANNPAPAASPAPGAPADKPAVAATAPPEPPGPNTSQPVQAEKVLGIDKVAKPGETPKSPFAGGDDDLLKDLK